MCNFIVDKKFVKLIKKLKSVITTLKISKSSILKGKIRDVFLKFCNCSKLKCSLEIFNMPKPLQITNLYSSLTFTLLINESNIYFSYKNFLPVL